MDVKETGKLSVLAVYIPQLKGDAVFCKVYSKRVRGWILGQSLSV